MLENDFWQNKSNSQKIIKEKKLYEDLINSHNYSIKTLNDLHELNQLAIEEKNQIITQEVLDSIKDLKIISEILSREGTFILESRTSDAKEIEIFSKYPSKTYPEILFSEIIFTHSPSICFLTPVLLSVSFIVNLIAVLDSIETNVPYERVDTFFALASGASRTFKPLFAVT